MSADHIHHLCWPEWEQDGANSRVAEVYRILDEAVGNLLGPVDGSKDVLVVSDHGGGSLLGVINLNAWLAREGYLAYSPERAIGGGQFGRRMLRDVSLSLRKHLPERLRYTIKQRAPGLREKVVELRDYSVIDWEKTRAFSYGTFGNIVVNLRGREEHGIVEPGDEYERLRDELIAKALELRGPEGEQIVAAVHRREDLYDGPAVDVIPDLIVEFAAYAWLGKGSLRTRSTELWDTIPVGPDGSGAYVGSHRHEGIVALSGPSAADAPDFFASIEDIAPTVLYLLGEPIPSDTEGRVLFESIDPDLVDRRPPEYADAETVEVGAERRYDEGDGEVEERLRALGYLE
jgi:predicted AlkP superfamily phosphohydrolase/phosphomutase